MAERELPQSNLIRNAISEGKNSSFVDYKDLAPINETSAVLTGMLSGGFIGMLPALFTGDITAPKKGYLLAGTAIGAVIGGVVGLNSAQTHNSWAERVLNRVDNGQQKGI